MTKYSYGQIQQIWIQYGGSRATAPLAAAVAMAESEGDSDSISPPNHDGTVDRGLWQINSKWWPQFSTTDLATNARGAVKISQNGTHWGDWTTYNTGAYKKFLSGTAQPSPVGGSTPVGAGQTSWYDPFGLGDMAGGAITDGIESGLTSAFKAIFGPIMQWSFWLGETALGFFAVFMGAQLIVKQTPMAKKGEQAAVAVVTKGAVRPEPESEPESAPVTQAAPKDRDILKELTAEQS